MATTSTFTSNPQLNADTNPKDVGYLLATTVDDQDAVVFTKTSLVQFLKLHGIQVDTNYTELKRLPKYATFGKLSKPTAAQTGSSNDTPLASRSGGSSAADDFTPASNVRDSEGKEFRPTRRVREAIGGGSAQISALFGAEDSGAQDVTPVEKPRGPVGGSGHNPISTVPGRPHHPPLGAEDLDPIEEKPRGPVGGSHHNPISTVPGRPHGPPRDVASEQSSEHVVERSRGSSTGSHHNPVSTVPGRPPGAAALKEENLNEEVRDATTSKNVVRDSTGREFRPTRRVREAIGGGSEQIASLFGGDAGNEENTPVRRKRGTFIVIEGLDRAGKSTQVDLLAQRLEETMGKDRVRIRKFPDRTTPLGQVLNTYLTSSSVALHPRAAHLLFSANRWELTNSILSDLSSGITTIADRYVASGIAYSLMKDLPLDWLVQPDRALPSPDLTLFLSISASEAAKRGGYGNERYEKEEIQMKVRRAFEKVEKVFKGEVAVAGTDTRSASGEWKTVDAGREREEVWEDVWREVKRVDDEVRRSGRDVGALFVEE